MSDAPADEKTHAEPSSEAADAVPTNGKPVMDVKVYAPFKIYFEGKAYSVTAVNETGPFDILPKHRNFLSMLTPCELMVEAVEGKKSIKISRALMHVKADSVVVFMDV